MNSTYQKADELIESDKFQECYQLIRNLAEQNYDPEACWRVAVCNYAAIFYGKSKLPDSEYSTYVESTQHLLEKALQKDPNHARCLTWLGICIDLKSRLGGINEKIRNSYTMKELWDKSVSIDPEYFVTYNCLAQWCYQVADLSSIKRAFAKTFFSAPPTSSFEEALKYAQKCYELKPDMLVGNLANLALCYKKLGDKRKAEEFAQKVISFHRDCIETLEAQEEVKSILK